MIDATTIDAMLAAGCTAEQLGAVVKAALAADEARAALARAAAAERQRQSRARRFGHAMSRDVTVTSRDICDIPAPPPFPLVPPSPEPLSPLYPPNPPPHPPEDGPARGANPVVVLGSILDPLNARRFADHCVGKGKRLSAAQAEEIVGELRAFQQGGGNPVDAVTHAIGRGWVTIRRDWLVEKPPPGEPARTARQAQMDEEMAALQRLTGVRNGSARADFSSGGPVVDAVPASGGRRIG